MRNAAFIPKFAQVVSDVLSWAAIIRESIIPAGTPLFAYGESLGGGILLHAALAEPEAFAGLTLFAPMVGIDADRVPNPVVQSVGKFVAWLAPSAAVAPVKDLLPDCFRDASMLPIARADPHRYVGAMRIGTAFQLKDAMDELSVRFADVTTPFIILHGTCDKITSPAASARLFEVSESLDKTMILYEGAFHVMWCESIDTREHILHNWLDWLLQRMGARREALPAQVASKQARPPGSTIFASAGHPLTLFSLQTHSELYTSSDPHDKPEWGKIDAHPVHQRSHPRHHWHPSYGFPHHGPLRLSVDKSIVTA
jgi:alpha-beta hydrolase superfamily lysophospholipase